MKKLKISIAELVFYCLGGGLALWGFAYIVLGLLANNLPIPVSQNPLKAADSVIASNFGLGFFPWGLIIFAIGIVIVVTTLIIASSGADKSYEKEARRASRVNRNIFSKEETVEAKVEEPTSVK